MLTLSLNSFLKRREEDQLTKVREQLQAERSAKLAEAEQAKLKGDFKRAAEICWKRIRRSNF